MLFTLNLINCKDSKYLNETVNTEEMLQRNDVIIYSYLLKAPLPK